MRELSERLYLTRRDFLEGLVTVGAVSVSGLSGCLEYIKPREAPKPAG
ncbi:MAG: twin-arginine translocation signal domain-containing protein [Methanobacteriota archaeon]